MPSHAAERFAFYGPGHVLALVATLAASAALIALVRQVRGRPAEPALRRAVCWALAGLLTGGAIAGQAGRVARGVWTVQESLPLHLCDIGLVVVVVALVGIGRLPHTPAAEYAPAGRGIAAAPAAAPSRRGARWQHLYELAYFWGLGGTLQALLTPDLEDPLPAFDSVRYFVTHGGIVTAVLVLTLGFGLRPLPGSPRRVWLLTAALALVVLPLDLLLGANYMYLAGPPKRPSLIDYLGRWPWSLLGLLAVGTVFIAAWYAPFWIADRLRARPGRVTSPGPGPG